MLYARSAFDYIPFADNLYWFAPFLIKTSAFRDEQNLPPRMNMPIEFCTGIVGCYSNAGIERAVTYI